MPIDIFPRTIENRLKIGRYDPILRHQSARIEPYRNSGTFIAEIGGFTALFGEVQSVCHPFATRKNKKDVMKEERVNMLNNQHVRPYNML